MPSEKVEVLTGARAEKHILLGSKLNAEADLFKSLQSIVNLSHATTKPAHGVSPHQFSFNETSVELNAQELLDSGDGLSVHQLFVRNK